MQLEQYFNKLKAHETFIMLWEHFNKSTKLLVSNNYFPFVLLVVATFIIFLVKFIAGRINKIRYKSARRSSLDSVRSTTIDLRTDKMISLSNHMVRERSSISNQSLAEIFSEENYNNSLTSFEGFFDEETDDDAERRRRAFQEFRDVKISSKKCLRESMQDTRNKLLDWSEKKELRRLNKGMFKFLQPKDLKDKDKMTSMVKTYLRRRDWLDSILELDPRQQIRSYFNQVAREGAPLEDPLAKPPLDIISCFQRAAAFSVWRPTSYDAISLMMKREGTGKGLDVKGKSAKKGVLSGKIPFIQIHDDKHKEIGKLGLTRNGRLRVYYKTKDMRKNAIKELKVISKEMKSLPSSSDVADVEAQELRWDVDDYRVYNVNEFGYGIDVSERVFYEACVLRRDIKREGDMITGRPSEPNFQSMNFDSTRKYSGTGPRTVVLQTSDSDPLRPQTLVVAYEENNSVQPCVSDFDCFLIGTRGIVYDEQIESGQLDVMKWMTNNIEQILNEPDDKKSWCSRWFDVLHEKNDCPPAAKKMPKCGFGDPKSYRIMEGAVARSVHNDHGAIRHGAECFNYYFPQEIDDELLVIADVGDFDGKVPFAYMKPGELQELMLKKIDDGFVFPLNPKWIIADKGWKRVYDKMMSSEDPVTQKSLETFFPKQTGIREQIESICQKHPDGFVAKNADPKMEGTEAYDLMAQKLKRAIILKRALLKVKTVRTFISLSQGSESQKKEKRFGNLVNYFVLKKKLRDTAEDSPNEKPRNRMTLLPMKMRGVADDSTNEKPRNRMTLLPIKRKDTVEDLPKEKPSNRMTLSRNRISLAPLKFKRSVTKTEVCEL